jgi:hypothetical protein
LCAGLWVARQPEESPAPKAGKHSSIIILTSGTPKGANGSSPPSLAPIGGILSHVPFKANEVASAVVRATVVVASFLQKLIEPAAFGPTQVLDQRAHGCRRRHEAGAGSLVRGISAAPG